MRFLNDANLSQNELNNVSKISFVDASVVEFSPGDILWDEATETLSYITFDDALIDVGQHKTIIVENDTGATLNKGSVIGFAGTIGASGFLKGKNYSASGTDRAEFFLGIAAHDILNTEIGHVITFGQIRNINTTGGGENWLAGDELFVHSSVVGSLTKNQPAAPLLKIRVGWVVVANETTGIIQINPKIGEYLGEQHNTEIDNIQNNQILLWNDTNSRWQNSALKTINGESIIGTGNIVVEGGGSSENLTSTVLTLGNYEVKFNSELDTLDIVYIG